MLGEADDDYKSISTTSLEPAFLRAAEQPRKVIGNPILFSLSNAWAKFRQVDTLRTQADTEKEFCLGAGYAFSRSRGG